jgi:hypothetical protein
MARHFSATGLRIARSYGLVPDVAVPVQPVLLQGGEAYSMFKDYWKYDWVLPTVRYDSTEGLLASLTTK